MACAANSLDIDVFGAGAGAGAGSGHQSTHGFAKMNVDGDGDGEEREVGEGEDGRHPVGDVSTGERNRSFSVDSTNERTTTSIEGTGVGIASSDVPPPSSKSNNPSGGVMIPTVTSAHSQALARLHGQGLVAAPPRLLGRVVALLRRWD